MTLDPNTLNEAAKLLNSDAGKAITLPAAHELGQFFGDIANIARFYATDNLGRIFTRWNERRQAENSDKLTFDEIKRTIPLLQLASMQADEDLQERWVSLLDSVAAGDPTFLPSFATSLSVLTPEQVQFLDRLWQFAIDEEPRRGVFPRGLAPFDEHTLVKMFDPTINPGMKASEVKFFGHRLSPEVIENYNRLLHCRMIIDNLVGLKILGVTQEVGLTPIQPGESFPDVGTKTTYAFTHYGAAFIRAVTPKAKGVGKA
jgi:hypothetical protein